MQKLSLNQSLSQKLSPQQIQFIKLLQVPTAELDTRVEEELEINPALEEGREEEPVQEKEEFDDAEVSSTEDLNVEDYLGDDDYSGYKMQGDGNYSDEEDREMPVAMQASLNDQLEAQLGFIGLDERQETIAKQLIGSIETDGYIRRELDSIVNDLAFAQNIESDIEELEELLSQIQRFDPPGIAARSLQECLLIQLERKADDIEDDPSITTAIKILSFCFDEFTKKHYDKIIKKLNIENDDLLKEAVNAITKLNPKPGSISGGLVKTQYLIPDFLMTNNDGEFDLTLNSRNAPELRVSQSYSEMFSAYDKSDKKDKKLKETVSFVKQKLDAAKWFIDAIKQRQNTLLRTMESILKFQYEFFLEGDETKLRPMILKDIANEIQMDISTVSRVANSKSIQTDFGIFPLKYFFSEGISTVSGEDVSSREVKNVLAEMISKEDKKKPLSDDKLEKSLKARGYNIARRTVAKYREQLNIPVARLRKEL
ncbi:RNA polymerase factor sigma-54 [Roseivirga sp.]|uniref:RNA polymerase factor sigma-54 n=1 Tax=Roseivirga sp. TaxID=1964215 RepID=UPI003B8B65CF